ncbi:hypothetical protein [Paenibacillus pabuli]|jgi:magnesium-transporting ATPase (P-type)|uniref:hypothetical protein n=1 Tax=Paenibacillus pabuli TaxID=1472 RepID=UPI000784E780|nr:hypothetical protein [Paenibacillus pabuli]MEC0126534.1 hypothetical protein [Paenibacillus pabuli]
MQNIFAETLTFTSIVAILIAIIKGVSLIKKPKIEKQILVDEQKIILHITQFVILTLFCSVFILSFLEQYTGDKISNYKNDSNAMLQILSSGLMLGFLVAYIIYLIYTLAIMNSKKHYINHSKYGKIYIIKSLDAERILLSNFDYETEGRFQLILKKDDVFEYKILRDGKKHLKIRKRTTENKNK